MATVFSGVDNSPHRGCMYPGGAVMPQAVALYVLTNTEYGQLSFYKYVRNFATRLPTQAPVLNMRIFIYITVH